MAQNDESFGTTILFDPAKVPEQFRSLIPLAQQWSFREEGQLMDSIYAAPLSAVRQLVEEIDSFPETLDEWIGKPGLQDDPYSNEWFALARLIDAYDFALLRLREENIHDNDN